MPTPHLHISARTNNATSGGTHQRHNSTIEPLVTPSGKTQGAGIVPERRPGNTETLLRSETQRPLSVETGERSAAECGNKGNSTPSAVVNKKDGDKSWLNVLARGLSAAAKIIRTLFPKRAPWQNGAEKEKHIMLRKQVQALKREEAELKQMRLREKARRENNPYRRTQTGKKTQEWISSLPPSFLHSETNDTAPQDPPATPPQSPRLALRSVSTAADVKTEDFDDTVVKAEPRSDVGDALVDDRGARKRDREGAPEPESNSDPVGMAVNAQREVLDAVRQSSHIATTEQREAAPAQAAAAAVIGPSGQEEMRAKKDGGAAKGKVAKPSTSETVAKPVTKGEGTRPAPKGKERKPAVNDAVGGMNEGPYAVGANGGAKDQKSRGKKHGRGGGESVNAVEEQRSRI